MPILSASVVYCAAMAVLDRRQGDPRRRKPESGGGCVEVEGGGAQNKRVSRIRWGARMRFRRERHGFDSCRPGSDQVGAITIMSEIWCGESKHFSYRRSSIRSIRRIFNFARAREGVSDKIVRNIARPCNNGHLCLISIAIFTRDTRVFDNT